MDALRLLDEARAARLAVALAGDKLIVRGPRAAEPIVRMLAAHKPALMAALAEAAEWRARHREVLAHHRTLHSPDKAASLAWGRMVNDWHALYGDRIPEWRCAGCDEAIGGFPALDTDEGSRMHYGAGHGSDCLIAYGRRWRGTAMRALAAMGLQPPPPSDEEEGEAPEPAPALRNCAHG